MTLRDTLLALLTMVMWGLAFVASRLALEGFSPLQLVGLRFLISALPACFIARPAVPWKQVLLVGTTLFAGQFLLLFFGMSLGLPPGVASATQQTQACFTVLFAALWLGEVPALRQGFGMGIAFCGIALVGSTAGADLKPLGLALGLGGALCWATGNILIKRLPRIPMFPLVIWANLVPPLPALLLSFALNDQPSLLTALRQAPAWSLVGVLYLALAGMLGYAIWGNLLQRYSAAVVAPFSLLSPCAGVVASAVLLGERFSTLRLGGMALIVCGLAAIVFPTTAVGSFGITLWRRPARTVKS